MKTTDYFTSCDTSDITPADLGSNVGETGKRICSKQPVDDTTEASSMSGKTWLPWAFLT